MNEKTAKLLRRWASHTKKTTTELKRWWAGLTAEQRTRERAKMEKALAASE